MIIMLFGTAANIEAILLTTAGVIVTASMWLSIQKGKDGKDKD